MNQKEQLVIIGILLLVTTLVGFDLITDFNEGVVSWHLFIEGFIGLSALFGIFFILRSTIQLKQRLKKEMSDFSEFKKEAEAWRLKSRKYLDGLSQAIDDQLSQWNLTTAEKEVAFLLLKGMSLKEIASIRSTAEKTARVQSMAIYAKSGLAGRSELSAFFLEDLLLPSESKTTLPDQIQTNDPSTKNPRPEDSPTLNSKRS